MSCRCSHAESEHETAAYRGSKPRRCFVDGCHCRRFNIDRNVVIPVDLAHELLDFVDNYADVNDGDYGKPVPNRALQLKTELERIIEGGR